MALTIENGTGVTGADSFITLAEYDAIHADLFSHDEHGSTAQREAALRRAWYYMKALPWKSSYPFPTFGGTIPEDVKTAQAVFAHYELDNLNGLAPSVIPGQQKILTRVGEIGWTPTGQTGADAQRANVLMAMDLLKPFINASGTTFLTRG